jgi:hypothetical protein
MIWEMITILAIVVVLFLGKKKIFFYTWAFIVGILVGLWWELTAETEFTYSGFSIYIWKDIPLAIILEWGVAISGLVLISDYLQEKIPISKKGKHVELINCFFWDFLVTLVIGMTMEILGSHLFNMWTYTPNDMPAIESIPIRWLAGWGWIGVFILAFIRRYDKFFEVKWRSNKTKNLQKLKG